MAGQKQMQRPLCQHLGSHSSSKTYSLLLAKLYGRLLTDLINDDTTKGDTPLPTESSLEQQTTTRAQCAADDVGL